MPTTRLDADYLVLGAGAMSMAFADVILSEHPSARLVVVDRRDSPGGHWNDAYPFVRLHQPAAFYGLNSAALGEGGADLASGPEVVAYYKRAMDRFRGTGRVQFLPMSDHQGDGRVVSTLDGDRVAEVTVHRRIVDGTLMKVEVPFVRSSPVPCRPRRQPDTAQRAASGHAAMGALRGHRRRQDRDRRDPLPAG
jgi:cation diffusion facilitator CzcD-associated flavoprotein CzcO